MFGGMVLHLTTGDGPNIEAEIVVRGEAAEETLVVLGTDEIAGEAGNFWSKRLPAPRPYVTLTTRGVGAGRWTRNNPPNTFERSLALLGQTVDAGRVRDVDSYLAYQSENKRRVRLVGRGPAGVIAANAAIFSPGTVEELTILDPPTSHRDGPHFLNVDRVLDLPTALGLLAPNVKLTLINAKDPAFDKTAAIYKLAGAADKFERK